MTDNMASSGKIQLPATKTTDSQSKQEISQGAFESQSPPQPLTPLPNTLHDTSAAQEGKKVEEKQDIVDSLKNK